MSWSELIPVASKSPVASLSPPVLVAETSPSITPVAERVPSEALVKLPALRPIASRSPLAVEALPTPDAEASPVTLALVLRVPIPPALRSMLWMP